MDVLIQHHGFGPAISICLKMEWSLNHEPCYRSREKFLKLRVYKIEIRPHLHYCVQSRENWSLIIRIESVQRRFTGIFEEDGLLPITLSDCRF